jgi:hypothetical protein
VFVKRRLRSNGLAHEAGEGDVELLEKLWNCAKELHLKPEDLRNVLWVSKSKFNQTAWHIATHKGPVQVLEELWDWDKEMQIKPEE